MTRPTRRSLRAAAQLTHRGAPGSAGVVGAGHQLSLGSHPGFPGDRVRSGRDTDDGLSARMEAVAAELASIAAELRAVVHRTRRSLAPEEVLAFSNAAAEGEGYARRLRTLRHFIPVSTTSEGPRAGTRRAGGPAPTGARPRACGPSHRLGRRDDEHPSTS